MIVAESRRGRRLVGRLERGLDLFDSLLALCRTRGVRSGELRASGSLDNVVLGCLDGSAAMTSRRFASPATIVSLSGQFAERDGKLQLEASCTIARDLGNGIELIGGQLLGARVHAVEFVVECYDDLLLRRSMSGGISVLSDAIEVPALAAVAPTAAAPALVPGLTPPAPAPISPVAAPAVVAPAVVAAPAPAPAAPAPAPSFPAPIASPHIQIAPAVALADGVAGPPSPMSFEARASGHYAARAPQPTPVEPARALPPTPVDPPRAPLPSSVRPAPTPPAATPSWAEVAERSASQGPVERVVDGEVDDGLRQGDVIVHPRFGPCDVERIEGQSDYAQVRMRNNKRLVRLSLDVLQLVRDGLDEHGRRRYRAVVAR